MNNINLIIVFSIVATVSLFAAGTMATSVFAMSHQKPTMHMDDENGTMHFDNNMSMPMDNMTMTMNNSTDMTDNATMTVN